MSMALVAPTSPTVSPQSRATAPSAATPATATQMVRLFIPGLDQGG